MKRQAVSTPFPEAAAFYHKGKRIVILWLSVINVLQEDSRPRRLVLSGSRRESAAERSVRPRLLALLFEIGAADIPVLAEGLGQLHPMRRSSTASPQSPVRI